MSDDFNPVFIEGEDYPNYQDFGEESYEDDEDLYYERISLSELWDQCIIPTAANTLQTMYPLLILCFLCRIVSIIVYKVNSSNNDATKMIRNAMSASCGLVTMHIFYEENILFILILILLMFPLVRLAFHKCRRWLGTAVSIVTLIYLLTCELLFVSRNNWHKIRGTQMILAMKIVSLAFDLESGVIHEIPGIFCYLGYVMHVGSVIFGPWFSFSDYTAFLNSTDDIIMDFFWYWKLLKSLFGALISVLISNCFGQWLIFDPYFSWIAAYRDALCFRFSHYFICRISELTITASGVMRSNTADSKWDITTTKILNVELPRSLVEVVISWNITMHHWLKQYVFRVSKPLGNFVAILLTYMISAILHGVNFQLSAVLLSLGFYTYIEFVLRRHLAEVFSMCIEARKCKQECKHEHKKNELFVFLVNLFFCILSIFHLSYLGLMFDNSESEEEGYNMQHTLEKWSQLNYASHYVAIFTYIFYLLL